MAEPNMSSNAARILWTVWTRQQDGQLVLVNGGDPKSPNRLVISPEDAPHLAAALAEHCDDNEERAFVRSEWGHLDDEEDDDA